MTGSFHIDRHVPLADHVRARPAVVLQLDAEALARRWFRRGLALGVAGTLALGLGALAAAQAGEVSINGSTVTLQPSEAPGAVGEVVFQNRPVNGWLHDGAYPVEMPGVALTVEFTWNAGPGAEDALTVLPPEGLICVPHDCRALVAEGGTGRVTLYPLDGVGF